MNSIILLSKVYDPHDITDMMRDLHEAFDERITPQSKNIPRHPGGVHKGDFRLCLEWVSDEDDTP